jgi:hypothetical protein
VQFNFDADMIDVSEEEISKYYKDNKSRFYHENAVDCRFLFCRDRERAKLAYNYLRNGIDFELVSLGFKDAEYEIADGLIEYSQLPESLRVLILQGSGYDYLNSIDLPEGWLLVQKLGEYEKGYYQIADVRDNIRDKIAETRAESLAYSRAKEVFDATTVFDDCYAYTDAKEIFETGLQNVMQPYPEIGDISSQRMALLHLENNEKLPQIIETPSGYAVLYLKNKVVSQERSYTKSLPQIREIYAASRQLELAEEYIDGIISKLKSGADADSLLYFLGGYQRIRNLGLDSEIPGFGHSEVLIEDMLNHEIGYYSPVLTIISGRLMFYYINGMRKISGEDFTRVKDEYRIIAQNKEYEKWLKEYRDRKRIKIEM